jgi:hypothetical protein
MNPRRFLTALGAGVTTFLLVAVFVIEFLDLEFSAIIGLPVGLLAGLAVFAFLWLQFTKLSPGVRRATGACAAFGLAILMLLALRYVNIGRGVFSVDVMAGIGIAVAVVVYMYYG